MNDDCGRFYFAEDMNGDGLTTISDALLWLKAAFLLPSNFVAAALQGKQGSSGVAQFFEMDCSTGQGGGGAFFSLLIWIFVLSVVVALVNDLRGK